MAPFVRPALERQSAQARRPLAVAAKTSSARKTKLPEPVATLEAGICHNLIGTPTKLYPEAARRVAADSAEGVCCSPLGDDEQHSCDEADGHGLVGDCRQCGTATSGGVAYRGHRPTRIVSSRHSPMQAFATCSLPTPRTPQAEQAAD